MNFSQIVCICQARQRRQFMTPFSIIATNHNKGFSINSKGGGSRLLVHKCLPPQPKQNNLLTN